METGKKAVESVKETASNIAASAVSGMDKTKATVQGKVDKMRAHDDYEKGLAEQRKEERITEAELRKQTAQVRNLDEKEARTGTGIGGGTQTHSYSTTGVPGTGTGAHQMSAMSGHGTGQPAGGHFVEGTEVGSHPLGRGTGTTRTTTAENRHVGGGL
ncbi:hypothetical protein RND81_14G054400 [Saponaria officinalis]|uniref:Uncharacterized protein n=1 Tax=Saponaria officinalis TaxID=3572 RepID=A0AAW1GJK7_SAPOF